MALRDLDDQAVAGASSAEGAQAVDRAMALLSRVAQAGATGIGLTDLAAGLGLSKPTARRLLMALMRSGMVEQDGASRRYYPGRQSYALGVMATRRHGLLAQAGDCVTRIARASGDTAFVSTRSGDWALCVHRHEGTFPVRSHVLQAGDLHPLGIGAGALAMLAAMPDRQAIIARLASAHAAYPGYTGAYLNEACALADIHGHAVNPGMVMPSSWGIGVAIRLPDGEVAGALSIAAPDSRMRPERQPELAQLLKTEAALVAGRLASIRMLAPRP